MKNSLAIAYAMKKKGSKKSDGGKVKEPELKFPEPGPQTDYLEREDDKENFPNRSLLLAEKNKMADGGKLDPAKVKSAEASMRKAFHFSHGGKVDEMASGYQEHEGAMVKHNKSAMMEDDRMLNQHGAEEQGPYGTMMAHGGEVGYQSDAHMLDMVGRIMAQRQKHYSEGGKIANDTGTGQEADKLPNQMDDLVLRDDLESSYGDDDNSGDALGNAGEDARRADVISRIMASRKKKDKNPSPA